MLTSFWGMPCLRTVDGSVVIAVNLIACPSQVDVFVYRLTATGSIWTFANEWHCRGSATPQGVSP